MAEQSRLRVRTPVLIDREPERQLLDQLVERVRGGDGQVLVLRAEPGMGKTALLDYLSNNASGCRVVRVAGVQSEMELAFAGLHLLCAPMLEGLEYLPDHQQDALRIALGLSVGPPPDRFLVGLAVLSLLAKSATRQPLLCLIDDEQWLDRATAQALGFAARRLGADRVGLVFASRAPGSELDLLPSLEVRGLGEDDARRLLDSVFTGPLDARVRDLIVAETGGNPLALLELPRGLTPTEMAGGFGLSNAKSVAGRIESSFTRQLEPLPSDTRMLLLLAAADSSGDAPLVWRAARRLGIAPEAVGPALEAALVEFDSHVRFWHPMVRSAIYRSATLADRRAAHRALANATDERLDPDRRAWHRAHASPGADEDVALDLERSASQAQARGGLAAAAAFLERAVAVSADPVRRMDRILAAIEMSTHAGAFEKAQRLVALAEHSELDEVTGARLDLLRGQIAFTSGMGSDAPPLLLKAARSLEETDLSLARDTYLTAWLAAVFAGHLAGTGDLSEVSRAARALPVDPASFSSLLIDGLAGLVTDGRDAAAPALQLAVTTYLDGGLTLEERLRYAWPVAAASIVMCDERRWHETTVLMSGLARQVGALDQLPIDLTAQGVTLLRGGELSPAVDLINEADVVAEAIGTTYPPYAGLLLAATTGDESGFLRLHEPAVRHGIEIGQGTAVAFADYARALLYNGLGRYAEAMVAGLEARQDVLYVAMWALPEVVEGAVRAGHPEVARAELTRHTQGIFGDGDESDQGLITRCRALLSEGEEADRLYREAIERLSKSRLRPDLARAHLLYGEWLRHERGRESDARFHLRAAYKLLAVIGAEGFAERARLELAAMGEPLRKRAARSRSELTAQETTVARLASDGLTNSEIGARLFLSARTVEWHLGNVFTKLGITSRRELHGELSKRL